MPDIETLQMALIGYQAERQKIQQKIDELEHRLSGRNVVTSAEAVPPRKRRKLSRAALAHIRAAQVKRWRDYRRKRGAPTKKTARKKVSPEVLKKRLEGLAKARAARAAKRVPA